MIYYDNKGNFLGEDTGSGVEPRLINTWKKTYGDDGMILRDTHHESTYYIGTKDYIVMALAYDLPVIRFNKNYFLDNWGRVIPIVKVEQDIFDKAQNVHKMMNYVNGEKMRGTNGIILPPTNNKPTYYVIPIDYVNLSKIVLSLPQVRFNTNYTLNAGGQVTGMVKVPFDVFKMIAVVKEQNLYPLHYDKLTMDKQKEVREYARRILEEALIS